MILFQGDSITVGTRNREFDPHSGYGYATMVMDELGSKDPYQYKYFKRGIVGNRVTVLYSAFAGI